MRKIPPGFDTDAKIVRIDESGRLEIGSLPVIASASEAIHRAA
jgi:hypothetical protein